jgi:DNA-binding transcriptional MerR regulator
VTDERRGDGSGAGRETEDAGAAGTAPGGAAAGGAGAAGAAPGGAAASAAGAAGATEAHGTPVQEALFDGGVPAPPAEDVGYRGPTACQVAGITYRQLDYWARTGLVTPSVRDATGSGTQRLYSFRDILLLKLVRRLLDTGISLQNIRTAIGQLRSGGAEDLADITLLSDGTTVYECTSPDEVVDLLQGGQGVFAIAVGRVVREVEGSLAELPGERAEDDTGATTDELAAARRRRRGA